MGTSVRVHFNSATLTAQPLPVFVPQVRAFPTERGSSFARDVVVIGGLSCCLVFGQEISIAPFHYFLVGNLEIITCREKNLPFPCDPCILLGPVIDCDIDSYWLIKLVVAPDTSPFGLELLAFR